MTNVADTITREAKLSLAWRAMQELGLEQVDVEFDGSGDSGSINNVSPPLQCDGVDEKRQQDFRKKVVILPGPMQHETSLHDLMEELSDALLSRPEIPNWYDGEGGNGTISWRINQDGTRRIEAQVNVAIVQYDASYFTYDPETGERDETEV